MKKFPALVLSVLVTLVLPVRAEENPFLRPIPEKGESAQTLLVYDTLGRPFSLINEVALIELLLGRLATTVTTRQDIAVTAEEVARADYIVIAGISGVPQLPKGVRLPEETPVFGIGWAAGWNGDRARKLTPSTPLSDARVRFAGNDWRMNLDPFFVFRGKPARVVAEVVAPEPTRPLAWQDGRDFGFATLPGSSGAAAVMADLLLDFYQVRAVASPGMLFVIQDFHPGSDAGVLRRMVDYLAARGEPFAVSVRLAEAMPEGAAAMPDEIFFESLRYAQAHGGRVVLRPENNASSVKRLLDEGLVPLACELPSAAGSPSRPLQGISYGLSLGRLQSAGPDENLQTLSATSVMTGPGGSLTVPLNIDPALPNTEKPSVGDALQELSRLRGSLAGVVIPAWYPFQRMRDLVDEARSSGLRVVDLAVSPHWIKTDEVIVTAKTTRKLFLLKSAPVERILLGENMQQVSATKDGTPEQAVAEVIRLKESRP